MDTMDMRRNAIVDFIDEKGTVSFSDLKKRFPNVSDMTLRTDLKALDADKRILRIHGGAKSVQTLIESDDFLGSRIVKCIEEKRVIAKKALKLLGNVKAVFIDSGSTTTMLSGMLPDEPRLIYTTGLTCATELTKLAKPTVILPGGKLNRFSQSVYGITTIKELERVNFDIAFLGVTGFHMEAGFGCNVNDEAILKQTAINRSERIVILMDSSKIGQKSIYRFCSFSEIDVVISDGKLPQDFLRECDRYGVEVI